MDCYGAIVGTCPLVLEKRANETHLKILSKLFIKLRGYGTHEIRLCGGIHLAENLEHRIQGSFIHMYLP